MKNILKALPFALATALVALAATANAQTVKIKGLGSSNIFLESGLAASNASGTTPIDAVCLWTSNSSSAANDVTATDSSNPSISPVTDTGSAWVAWTKQGTSCNTVNSSTVIYSYLQTDSVVGNRCLFNAHAVVGGMDEDLCTIAYPVNTSGVASSDLIYPANNPMLSEVPLPSAIATALNSAIVNVAGTDIRPEDAEFATARAITACGTAIVDPTTGDQTQYLGLGYDPTLNNNIQSFFSSSLFHVVNFALPSSYTVTPVGATPVVVAVNGSSMGLGPITDISSANLAQFLDGRNSWSGQANGTGASGEPVTVLIREPISGTYNTMEYNVPNRTQADASGFPFKTSQDVGVNQPASQIDCPSSGVGLNPMNIVTASGAHRRRAIGTGQELSEVLDTTNNGSDILGYSFWSLANFNGFAGSTTTHYLTVDGIDPLYTTTPTGNPIPTLSSSELPNVTLQHVIDGTYPIWSLIRFVTVDSTSTTNAQTLATATDNFVSFGTTSARPDFVVPHALTVVRSHFIPPAGTIQPTTAANGNVGLPVSNCTNPELGGDVGGVVILLATDSTTCRSQPAGMKTGTTGERR